MGHAHESMSVRPHRSDYRQSWVASFAASLSMCLYRVFGSPPGPRSSRLSPCMPQDHARLSVTALRLHDDQHEPRSHPFLDLCLLL